MDFFERLILPVLAILVSIVALWKSVTANKRAISAQIEANTFSRRMLAIEDARERDRTSAAAKAIVVPFVERDDRNDHCLNLKNDGVVSAKNIQLEINGVPLKKPMPKEAGVILPKEVPSTLGAGCRYDKVCILLQSARRRQSARVRVTWDDESGKTGVNETSL